MLKWVLREIIIVFLLGGVPILLAYFFGGVSELEKTSVSLLSTETYIFYNIGMAAVYVLVSLYEWLIFKKDRDTIERWAYFRSVLSEVGFGILSILRVSSGILLTFTVLWYFVDYDSFSLKNVTGFIVYGIIAFIECVIFSTFYRNLKKIEPKSKNA